MIRTGIDWATDDGDETVMIFAGYDQNGIVTILAELRGEPAEYVAHLKTELELTQAELARLQDRVALVERAEAQMIGEDAQPLPEWEWYFDEVEALDQPEEEHS